MKSLPFALLALPQALIGLRKALSQDCRKGFVSVGSRHSVEETMAKIQDLLRTKGVKLFTVIDHSGEAERAGIEMRPTKLVIFGNPKAGTPLMLASPTVAIDLPLKLLVWQDASGRVWISYNSLEYLAKRHELRGDLMKSISVIESLAHNAGE